MKKNYSTLLILLISLSSNLVFSQETNPNVHIVGKMKNVMWEGKLQGTINIDTISNKEHLYGLGPVEYLKGEIMVIDGKSYKSTVVSDTSMKIEETYNIKAPFFGYTNITSWTEYSLPDSILSIQQLELHIDDVTKSMPRPFFFKLSGSVEQATIHVVNLPNGSKVRSPDEAHNGQTNFELKNTTADIIGFFSTEHKAIFTHHDTYLHMHLITNDRKSMGHLDKLILTSGGIKLYLPK
jgi:acetolactate decarboxylase